MDWKDLGKSLVSQGASLLGGVLGGPAGAVAGKMVAGLFGTDPDSPEEAMNAIQADPDALSKLKEFEMRHKEKLQELQLEETRAFLADRDSARQREMAMVSATGEKDNNIYIIAYIVIGSFFLLTGYMLYAIFSAPPTMVGADGVTVLGIKDKLSNDPVIMLIIGALISGFTQVLSYFFGSSKGSSEKTKMMGIKG
ncbi:MAG: hypothetical protein OEM38_10360 [Gammaproteobacteria bacterium]|nr:hypothetical protein [Gammaproteobacteria bacterium]